MLRIQEFSDVMVDACLRDSAARLMFLSAYGRDGALMQLLSALQLPESERGVRRFSLVDESGARHLVDVGDSARLAKHAGKLPRHNLFGPVGHLWLYDESLVSPDRANRVGWVFWRDDAPSARTDGADGDAGDARSGAHALGERGWQLLRQLSPVPLLDHWRGPLWAWACEARLVSSMSEHAFPPLGPVQALRIGLADSSEPKVGEMVRAGVLRLREQAGPADGLPSGRHDALAA